MKNFIKFVFIGISSILLSSCLSDVEVKTGEALNITSNSAEVTCSVETDQISDIDEFGVLFSTSKKTVEDKAGNEAKTTKCSNSTYTVSLYLDNSNTEPQPGTKYYYCGYVKSGSDYYYGDIKSFSTPK